MPDSVNYVSKNPHITAYVTNYDVTHDSDDTLEYDVTHDVTSMLRMRRDSRQLCMTCLMRRVIKLWESQKYYYSDVRVEYDK